MRSAICRESISVYPSLMHFLGVEADAEREIVADLPPDRGDDLGGEAHPVLEGAPVPVGARVPERQERRERVGVGHVKLDAVEPGAARAPRRRPRRTLDGPDLLGAEIGDLLPPARARDLEEVDDLRDDLGGAGVVDRFPRSSRPGR